MREFFRRLVFNILIDNTDDHEKNHVLLVTANQHYALAPAFDVLPIGQSLGYQALVVGNQGAESSIENALGKARMPQCMRAFLLSSGVATRVTKTSNPVPLPGFRGGFAGLPSPVPS